jgi:hypothetical protein
MSIAGFSAKLRTHFDKFQTSPYLFIGSGLSRRYLQLPTWHSLLEEFTQDLGLQFEFGYYASQVQGNLPKLASIIAEEFHKIWWTSEKYEVNRAKYYKDAQSNIQQPFKIELAIFVEKKSKLDPQFLEEIELMKKVIIDGVITTNWDTFTLLEDFETFVGQYQLLFTDNASIGEIYKIHGCISKPESLIVTEEDYNDFHRKNKFLAAKLFTIFAEHPIVFLGYSISDRNIISILNSIVECLDNQNVDQLRDRLVFVEWVNELSDPQLTDGHIIIDNLPLPIKHIRLNSYIPLFEVLASLKQRLPIKILRKCKNAVYELVKTKNPVNTILVGDLDTMKSGEDIEFVIGVGVANQYSEQGYIGISNIDIFEDVIFENKPWSPEIVIRDVIPKLYKGNVYLPIYKYLRTSGELDDHGKLIETGDHSTKLIEAVKKNTLTTYYSTSITYLRKKSYIETNFSSIIQLEDTFDFRHVLLYIPFLKVENIDLEELGTFLKLHYNDLCKNMTDFKKVVCMYDYLKFGLQIHYYNGLLDSAGMSITKHLSSEITVENVV